MEKSPKNPQKFSCIICHYYTCNFKDYNKHLTTQKHKNRTNLNVLEQKIPENPPKYYCDNCNKCYNVRNSLWYHKKICINKPDNCSEYTNESDESNEHDSSSKLNEKVFENSISDKELIQILIDQCKELRDENKELISLIKNGTHNNITNMNCNNKTFNLQVFLNETCKDAMNIMDFVESIKLQLSDLESVGELGYVKGISNIIVKNLRALDVTKRPVHCSDAKREILYIKDNDVWEKEDGENTKMKKAVKYIAYKNTKLLPLWKQTYPECMQFESSKNDKYNYMVIEAMGGMGDNEGEKINKIIKQIAKEVVIEK